MDSSRRCLAARADLTRRLRHFFWERGFDEVDTYLLTRQVAPEPGIEPVAVAVQGPEGQQRFLQTSCELSMKRLLADGFDRIFQVAPSFRDGEVGPWHRPEFRLVEWYRRGAHWGEIVADCEALVAALLPAVLARRGRRLRMVPPFPQVRMESLFVRHAGFSILDATSPPRLAARLAEAGIHHAACDSWDDLFHRAFLARVQPVLDAAETPVFVTHFPAPAAGLSRLCPADPRASLRFELFVAGVELANGFQELTDSRQQASRFVDQRRQRQATGGRLAPPLGAASLAFLDRIGEAAGVALGLERLIMLATDAANVDEVSFVPWAEA